MTDTLPTGLGPQETAIHRLLSAIETLSGETVAAIAQEQADVLAGPGGQVSWDKAWVTCRQACFTTGRYNPDPLTLAPDPIDDAIQIANTALTGRAPAELEGLPASHTYWGVPAELIAGDAITSTVLALVVRDKIGTITDWNLDAYDLLTGAVRRAGIVAHPDDAPVTVTP